MVRLQRRGIGKFYRDRLANKDESLRQSIEGLEKAYDELWADAEKCIGDHENSRFWALMFRTTSGLMGAAVRDMNKMMERSLLTAVMEWNAGMIRSGEIGKRAFGNFERWFYGEFLPEHDKRCEETDKKLLSELNGFIKETMESNGVHPVELRYLCTDDYYRCLRSTMTEELLPTIEVKMQNLVPDEIRDTRFHFLRRRRLCRGVDSFYARKKELGGEFAGFVCDVLITEKQELEHANSVLHALGRSMVSEALYLLS